MHTSLQRAQAAIAFIESKLDREFTLDELAEEVGVSRFVLHRTFRACIGESLKGYIRKRRLTEAAEELKHTKHRIIELALGAGFASQEAFTRAFQGYFGVTPGHYRRDPSSRRQPGLFRASPALLLHRFDGISHQPRIVERTAPTHVVGWGIGAEFEDDTPIIALWETLLAHLDTLPHPPDTLFGISQPEHPDITLTEDQCFAYIAGTERHSWPSPPRGTKVLNTLVPAGLYAVFTHDGPLEHIIDTVNYAWASWLPQSEYHKSARPDLESISFGNLERAAPHMKLWVSIET